MYLLLLLLLCITVVAIADYTKWNISSISSRKLERFIDQASNFFSYIRGKKHGMITCPLAKHSQNTMIEYNDE